MYAMCSVRAAHTHKHHHFVYGAMNLVWYECDATMQYNTIIFVLFYFVLHVQNMKRLHVYCLLQLLKCYITCMYCKLNISISIIIKYGIGCFSDHYMCAAAHTKFASEKTMAAFSAISRNETISCVFVNCALCIRTINDPNRTIRQRRKG